VVELRSVSVVRSDWHSSVNVQFVGGREERDTVFGASCAADSLIGYFRIVCGHSVRLCGSRFLSWKKIIAEKKIFVSLFS
jgi:hypothetical protein